MMPFSGQASFCFDCEYSVQEVWGLGFRNVPESSSGTIRIIREEKYISFGLSKWQGDGFSFPKKMMLSWGKVPLERAAEIAATRWRRRCESDQ